MTNGGARFIYDADNSTQLEWGDTATNIIMERTVRQLSVSIQDPNAYRDATSKDIMPR